MLHIAKRMGTVVVFGLGWTLALIWLLSMKPLSVRAAGPILYVATTGSDATDCTDSANPCATVQYAVDRADVGAEIRVASGVYTGVHTRDLGNPLAVITQVVFISRSLSIVGGYASFGDLPNPEVNPTILDAQGQGRVLYVDGPGIGVTLTNLYVTGGRVSTDYSPNGAGMYVANARVTVDNSTVYSNAALGMTSFGGGLFIQNSDAVLTDSVVSSNTATFGGGGLHLRVTTATLSHNVIVANIVPGPGLAAIGGGISLERSSVILNGNEVLSNSAGYGGGLMINQSNGVHLIANKIAGNSADSGAGLGTELSAITLVDNIVSANLAVYSGGGLYLDASTASLEGDIIVSNTVPSGEGGGIVIAYTDAVLTNTVIAYNAASRVGGGVGMGNAHAVFTNTIVADNRSASSGSGVYVKRSSLSMLHATIARNRGGEGSGVYIGLGSTAMMTNTILVSQAVGVTVTAGSTATLGATLWGDGAWANAVDWAGEGTILTGTLNVWGDPAFVGPDAGDYHVGLRSAALDVGINTGVETDIDGDPRPLGAGYDLGADEYAPMVVYSAYLPVVMKQNP